MDYSSDLLQELIQDAETLITDCFIEALRPEEKLTVWEWADQKRVLSSKTSGESGPWRTSRTPYLQEIMECLSISSPVEEVDFMKGTQVGGTEVALNFIGYVIDYAPAPMMVVWPTSNLAKRNSKTRLTPLIEESQALRAKVKPSRSRDSGNTTMLKEFPGGLLVVAGANSAVELKSQPIKYDLDDEIDEYPDDVDNQGDPLELIKKRRSNFARTKSFKLSSPTVEGFSKIDKRFKNSDQRYYEVPCPHCREKQALVWEQMKWETRKVLEYICVHCGTVSPCDGLEGNEHTCSECGQTGEVTEQTVIERDTKEVIAVWYECEHCDEKIDEHHKTWMLENGTWSARNPGPHRSAGFHLSALYSPLGWYSWLQAVIDWIESENNPEKRKTFINTVLALTYSEKGLVLNENDVKARAENYRLGMVPMGGLLLVGAVDVQGNRLECEIDAFGRNEENWLVDHQVFYGDPEQSNVWEALDEYLKKTFTHESGIEMKLTAVTVDSGYLTQTVYDFCRTKRHRHIIPIKGVHGSGKPILMPSTLQDVDYKGKKIKEGVELWPLGVDSIKTRVQSRLRIEEPGPNCIHHPLGLPDTYYAQLTAEQKIPVVNKRTGQTKYEWRKKPGAPNEAFDLKGYAYAAAIYAGMAKVNWDVLEQALGIRQADMFAQPAAVTKKEPEQETSTTPVPTTATAARRRRRVRNRSVH